MIECGLNYLKESGQYGYIIPLSLITASKMESIRKYVIMNSSILWSSSYGIRPSKVFKNVEQRVCITFGVKDSESDSIQLNTSGYILWNGYQRKELFNNISYFTSRTSKKSIKTVYKISTNIEAEILKKINGLEFAIKDYVLDRKSKPLKKEINNYIYYHSAVRYWIKALENAPEFVNEGIEGKSSKYKQLFFKKEINKYVPLAVINSSLFFWYWIISSDCRDLTLDTILNFKIDLHRLSEKLEGRIIDTVKRLMENYSENSHMKTCKMATIGEVIFREYHPKYSKSIIDEIDELLGELYGFTKDQIEFIKNYQLRYRMGDDVADEDE